MAKNKKELSRELKEANEKIDKLIRALGVTDFAEALAQTTHNTGRRWCISANKMQF